MKFGEDFDLTETPKKPKSKKRVLVKDEKKTVANIIKGKVIGVKGKNYIVKQLDSEPLTAIDCFISGSLEVLHPHYTLITVGDYVHFELIESPYQKAKTLGRIVKVEGRDTFLMRKSIIGKKEDILAANMNYVCIVIAAKEPNYNLRLLDKILVAVEQGNAKPIIIVNKIDLVDQQEIQQEFSIYQSLGYKVLFLSAKENQNLDELRQTIQGTCSLFIGGSGVGKSTLINKLLGKEIQKVRDLSKKSFGRHTTTFSRLFVLDSATEIIDSPGFREFDIWNVAKDELQFYFSDFKRYFQKCKFQPCSHTHEPNCAVKSAVKRGKISFERYISYLYLYESIDESKY